MSLTMLRTAAPITRPFAARALYAGPSLLSGLRNESAISHSSPQRKETDTRDTLPGR